MEMLRERCPLANFRLLTSSLALLARGAATKAMKKPGMPLPRLRSVTEPTRGSANTMHMAVPTTNLVTARVQIIQGGRSSPSSDPSMESSVSESAVITSLRSEAEDALHDKQVG
jgi:hypothetical protein